MVLYVCVNISYAMSVWNHFDVSAKVEDGDTKKAKCKHCPAHISYCGRTSSNLMTHVKVSIVVIFMYFILCFKADSRHIIP